MEQPVSTNNVAVPELFRRLSRNNSRPWRRRVLHFSTISRSASYDGYGSSIASLKGHIQTWN